jgi:hypothetical protein
MSQTSSEIRESLNPSSHPLDGGRIPLAGHPWLLYCGYTNSKQSTYNQCESTLDRDAVFQKHRSARKWWHRANFSNRHDSLGKIVRAEWSNGTARFFNKDSSPKGSGLASCREFVIGIWRKGAKRIRLSILQLERLGIGPLHQRSFLRYIELSRRPKYELDPRLSTNSFFASQLTDLRLAFQLSAKMVTKCVDPCKQQNQKRPVGHLVWDLIRISRYDKYNSFLALFSGGRSSRNIGKEWALRNLNNYQFGLRC